jgi:hypothetical protein
MIKHSSNRKLFHAVLMILIIISLSFIACESSTEQRYVSSIVKDINNWFHIHRSINYKKGGELRNEEEKNEAIKLRKLSEGLDTEWKFKYENIKMNEITLDGTIFLYTYIFENNKSKALRIYYETYYYDITSILPVPVKKIASESINQESTTLYEKYLWDGGFYDYMTHYFNLKMTMDDKH